jgi:endoglucanase
MTDDGALVGWSNPWSGPVVIEHGPDPVDGTNVVNVWHNRRVQTTLNVEAGKRVEIRAWVRARIPDGFVDNPVITDRNSAAFRAAGKFKRGMNFSNYFDTPIGEDWGGGPLVDADFDAVKREGFDHVRLPVSWNYHTGEGPSFSISAEFFERVDTVITGLMARGINVIVNVHHFREFYTHPDQWTNKLYAIWDQLASHYRGFPDGLAFEILNEPHDQATTEFMNGVYVHLLPRIRASNPSRTILVGPGHWNSISQLPALRLPADDTNLIVTVHCYDPFYYTHQGASWSGPSAATTNVVYPGPPPAPVPVHPLAAKNAGVVDWFEKYNTLPTAENPCSSNGFNQAFQQAKAWSDHYGRPVHVGEFGAFSTSDVESRVRYYREMRECMERHGLGWASWDWKAGFNYWDPKTGAPISGMRQAFFPK